MRPLAHSQATLLAPMVHVYRFWVGAEAPAISGNSVFRLLVWMVADARGAGAAMEKPLALTVGRRLDSRAHTVTATPLTGEHTLYVPQSSLETTQHEGYEQEVEGAARRGQARGPAGAVRAQRSGDSRPAR
mgnify:CR=1 FL=1